MPCICRYGPCKKRSSPGDLPAKRKSSSSAEGSVTFSCKGAIFFCARPVVFFSKKGIFFSLAPPGHCCTSARGGSSSSAREVFFCRRNGFLCRCWAGAPGVVHLFSGLLQTNHRLQKALHDLHPLVLFCTRWLSSGSASLWQSPPLHPLLQAYHAFQLHGVQGLQLQHMILLQHDSAANAAS